MTFDETSYQLFAARPPLSPAPPRLFLAVTSTGIFCRPGCPARLPKRENCLFFSTAQDAVAAGFRACKRCHPARMPGEASDMIKQLTALIEHAPDQKWGEARLREIGIDPSTARRQFKARFGLSFLAYARARRLAYAAQNITQGDKVITAQMTAGYESASGFRRAFGKTFGKAPSHSPHPPLCIDWIDTPLGPMVCVCSDEALYLLEFTDRVKMDRQFEKLKQRQNRAIVPGKNEMTSRVREELSAYFGGTLMRFTLPLITSGTEFQSAAWDQLMAIPYGQTRSYAQLAQMIGNPKAVRAVANSNANNGLAIIIPCHRVIATGGGLGGYAGSIARKRWLLDHEARHAKALRAPS